MFNFFKKQNQNTSENKPSFEIELTAAVLAYEIARSDGDIDSNELFVLMEEIEKIAIKVGKESFEILKIVESYRNCVQTSSLHQLINNYYCWFN